MKLISHLTTINNRRILFLINPKSNDGHSLRYWRQITRHFPELKESLKVTASDIKLLKLIKDNQPKYVAVAAGDGTINYIVRRLLKIKNHRPILSIIPLGYGNALAYNLGFDSAYSALDALINQNHFQKIDIIKTNNRHHPVCLFNISIGYDAQIVRYTQKTRYIGLKSYLISAIRSFFDYVPKTLRITVDNNTILESETESLVVANAPYIGQSFLISPTASLTNGQLDCVLFPSKYAYLTNLRFKGFPHPLYRKTGKVYFAAKEIVVESVPYLQIDGDPVIHRLPLKLSILPNCLECVCK